uniref:2-oxopent-4-dienoate hydratase n=1 Tax=Diaphorobacter sp. PCA039 TaxID=266831 RepID=C0KGM6_9BURK|nr:2-oxopent-4-dienoate hydratase [Diaphorobacter sp. PCA039]
MSDEANGAAANAADGHAQVVASSHRHHDPERARQDHLASLQRDAVRAQRVGQPGHGIGRVAQGCGARAGGNDVAVFLQHHAAGAQIDIARVHQAVAQHEHAARCVVGHGVLDLDLPVAHARIDDLEAGHHAFGGGQHIGGSDAGAFERLFQHEGNFALGLGLDQRVGLDGLAFVEDHAVGQPAKVRLEHAQHVHHGLGGHANFFAHHFFTGSQAAGQHFLLDGVGVVDGDVGVAVGQGLQHPALRQGLVQLVAQLFDQGRGHGHEDSLDKDVRKIGQG